MRLKLDENLGAHHAEMLRSAAHDVDTVHLEELTGSADGDVLAAAVAAGRALVTLDLDFADPWRFPPSQTAGIAVLRVRTRPSRADLEVVVARLAAALAERDMTGRLWVIDLARVREYEPPPSDPE